MTTSEIIIAVSLLVIGLVGMAICAGVETGIYSLSRVKLSLRALPSAATDDPAASAEYRAHLIGVMARRAVAACG